MAHVFLSYSHQDAEYVTKLAESLEDRGIQVWADSAIDYGDQYPRVIEEHLDNCGAVVLVMSEDSKASAWVPNEVEYAKSKNKKILPLLLSGDIWLMVASEKHADVTGGKLPPDEFYDRLIAVLGEAAPQTHIREVDERQSPHAPPSLARLVGLIEASALELPKPRKTDVRSQSARVIVGAEGHPDVVVIRTPRSLAAVATVLLKQRVPAALRLEPGAAIFGDTYTALVTLGAESAPRFGRMLKHRAWGEVKDATMHGARWRFPDDAVGRSLSEVAGAVVDLLVVVFGAAPESIRVVAHVGH